MQAWNLHPAAGKLYSVSNRVQIITRHIDKQFDSS